ncbi:MAG: DUF721 domain-containing protein [Verrucomicrobiota bacterium]|nr:DUF721 domain-containing protein [Verrucomicrobiota bacterium]MEC8753459.1 DUF721 domain-containing protein [Verrucomicrobiota bacterium]|tara:strand:- start:6818 stop:7201 length:384 start_codon:yes stop_codon:yes gene_type:complete
MEDIRNKIFNKERFEIDKDRLKILHYESAKRDAKPIKDILPSIIKTLDEPIQDSILILRDNWLKLFGEQISKFSQPAFIKNRCLFIYVFHPGWITELKKSSKLILVKLNENFNSIIIRDIKLIYKDV